jgi:hypothetical protein
MAWHIAQLNVARAAAPLESPQMAEFVAALAGVNALAEGSPGFVWRLVEATAVSIAAEPGLLVNMSVWQSIEDLFAFVYRSGHTPFMVRRREWFQPAGAPYQALWWVPAGGPPPTVAEAMARLAHLRTHGPSAYAFTFKQRFPAPGQPGEPSDMQPERYCAG